MTESKTDGRTWPDNLLNLLDRQQSLTQRLSSLAEAQTSLIAGRQTDALLGLLGQRQQIVDELVASQDELAALTGDLDDRLGSTAEATRQRIRSLVAEIGRSLEAVSQRDAQDEQSLRDGCDQTRTELASLDAGKTARNAYVNAARSARDANRFADRKG